jgi:hypothetical protein
MRGWRIMDHEGLFVSERIKEVTMMCGREQSIYDQISSFGIALYVLGFFDSDNILSIDDIGQDEAAMVLQDHFTEIQKEELPVDYQITKSREKYLVVIGDPLFPKHFAVFTDSNTQKPFFSKLRYFGCGFDNLEELMSDFTGEDGLTIMIFIISERGNLYQKYYRFHPKYISLRTMVTIWFVNITKNLNCEGDH